MIDDTFDVKPLTISSSVMRFILQVLTLSSIIVFPMMKLRKCSMPITVALVVVISLEWPLPRKSCALDTFGLLSLEITLRKSNNVPIVNYMPLRLRVNLLPSILSSQPILYVNGLLTLWSFNPHLLITISILLWPSTVSPYGLKPCPCSITLKLLHLYSSLTMLPIDSRFRSSWFLTMVDTLKMRSGVSYP